MRADLKQLCRMDDRKQGSREAGHCKVERGQGAGYVEVREEIEMSKSYG